MVAGQRRGGSILVVDNDVVTRNLLTVVLDDAGYRCAGVPDAPSARSALMQGDYTVALIDLRLPHERAHDLVQWVDCVLPEVATVVMSTLPHPSADGVLLQGGSAGRLAKPFSVEELLGTVYSAWRPPTAE